MYPHSDDSFQKHIENELARQRRKEFLDSPQLSLGEMIDKCKAILDAHKDSDGDDLGRVMYDFGYMFPRDIDSWRGSYAELALDYQQQHYGDEDPLEPMTLTEFVAMLEDAEGRIFTGYKGGEFLMTRDTPVWVSNYSESCQTAIVDVTYDGYWAVIIHTNYQEY